MGAFAVNRESLGPSTVKTVKIIKDSKWVLGMFPQGTRGVPGEIRGVTKGFAGLAKLTKCAILPVGILGTNEVKRWPFTGKIVVKIGKPIPYSNNPEETTQKRNIKQLFFSHKRNMSWHNRHHKRRIKC